MFPHCSEQWSVGQLVINSVTLRLFCQDILPVSPPPHAQWGGMCLHEAMRPSGDAEQVTLPEKLKTRT